MQSHPTHPNAPSPETLQGKPKKEVFINNNSPILAIFQRSPMHGLWTYSCSEKAVRQFIYDSTTILMVINTSHSWLMTFYQKLLHYITEEHYDIHVNSLKYKT